MNDLQTFDFNDDAVRVVTREGEPWFVAADVARILGYDHTPSMVRQLDDDEADVHNLHSSGQSRQHTIISESGLYNAIFRSRRPEARAFRRWVTETVLPAIRRVGGFVLAAEPPAEILPGIDPARMSVAIAAVSLMRKLRGNAVALDLWAMLGLPMPHGLALEHDDDLATPIGAYAATHDGFTLDELGAALGLDRLDHALRRRFGDILSGLGLEKRRTRRGRTLAWCWHRGEA